MNNLDKKYQQLLSDIIEFGVEKEDRTGTGTISEFGHQIRHKMSEGFPLLTTKKMHWKSIVTELLWFLRGDTNIKFLLDYDCHIWDGDAYKNYQTEWLKENPPFSGPYDNVCLTKEQFTNKIKADETFAKTFGDLGPIYGKQWRSWGSSFIDDLGDVYTNEVDYDIQNGRLPYGSSNRKFVIDTIKKHNPRIDQIQNLINELKTNPDSRRLMVSAWNVGELDQMVLPPCHYGFQLYTRKTTREEKIVNPGKYRAISLMWNQRSVDTFLGLPFNIASYGLLLEIIAKEVNMIPDELIGNLGDVHLYKNHIEQAKEQISRTSFDLPTIQITERNWYQHQLVKERLGEKTLDEKLKSYRPDCFELIGYESHPKIKAPLSN